MKQRTVFQVYTLLLLFLCQIPSFYSQQIEPIYYYNALLFSLLTIFSLSLSFGKEVVFFGRKLF